jgi:hypothetical protein
MAGPSFEPEKALGKKLAEMDKQELCAFISDLCSTVVAEVGSRGRRGGIYPDNISIDAEGRIAIGQAGKSPWQGQELEFIAPEQYWDGQLSAATDVYAVGLLMYYAVNDGKIVKCAIEMAWRDGEVDFQKPISCHLYPIRIKRCGDYDALNYERIPLCFEATEKGERLGVPVYRFLKEPLIRKYGEAFYDELCLVASEWKKQKGAR